MNNLEQNRKTSKKISKKVDAEKLTEIVEKAKDPKTAIKGICKLYPEFNAKEMEEKLDFMAGQLQNSADEKKSAQPAELTENELEMVAGGSSAGDWFSKNWKTLLLGMAIGVGAAFALSGVAAMAVTGELSALGAVLSPLAAVGALAGNYGTVGIGIVAGGMALGAVAGAGVTAAIINNNFQN